MSCWWEHKLELLQRRPIWLNILLMDIWVILQYIFRYLSIPIWLYSYSLLMRYLCLTSLLGMDHTNVFRYKNDVLQDYSFIIAAVLPALRIGNPKCLSVNKEWLNKAWYIHTMLFDKPREKRMFMEVERWFRHGQYFLLLVRTCVWFQASTSGHSPTTRTPILEGPYTKFWHLQAPAHTWCI